MLKAVARPTPGAPRRHAVAVVRPDSLVRKAVRENDAHRVALLDRAALPGERWLAGAGDVPDDAAAGHHDLVLGSRIWSAIALREAPPPGPARSTLLLALGLLGTASIAGLTALLYRWRTRVALEAAWRTRDLQTALRQLEASQQRFEDFLAAASDWYWETDAQYRFTFRSAGTQAGDHLEALIGLDRLTADDPEMEVAPRRARLDRHQPFARMRCILTTEEGQESISFTGRPVFAADGTFLGYRGSARDVTAAAKAEAAERVARVAAEAATRAKSNFLANMSHEIRTPMNGMIGMAQILRHSGLDPAQRRNVDLILRSANSLLAVLNDILDYSKLEVGSIQLEAVPCQLAELMDVMMPNLDGVQATRAIRALPPPHCEVPIIALTANALAGHREEYLKAGMDDYVSKPIARAALYRAIERRLGLRAFAQVKEQAPAPAPAPDAKALEELNAFMATLG
jgi:signal transduction histidine kinase